MTWYRVHTWLCLPRGVPALRISSPSSVNSSDSALSERGEDPRAVLRALGVVRALRESAVFRKGETELAVKQGAATWANLCRYT